MDIVGAYFYGQHILPSDNFDMHKRCTSIPYANTLIPSQGHQKSQPIRASTQISNFILI